LAPVFGRHVCVLAVLTVQYYEQPKALQV